MPRTVARTRAALAGALLVAALAAPTAARAESLSVAAGSDPTAGIPNSISYEFDTAGQPENITIVVRPASGPPCAQTSVIDAANVGPAGGTNITPSPLEVNGHNGGTIPYTFPTAGGWRICGWLARTPDDVAASAIGSAEVRLPRASIAVAPQQDQPKAGGSGLIVRLTGSTEAPNDVFVTAVPAGSACPPTYDQDTDPLAFDVVPAGTATRVSGSFDLQFTAHDLLSFRAWRVCAFVQDGATASAAAATGSAIADLLLKPQLLRRPKVKRQGAALTCDGGKWKARPAPKYAYAWLAGGRPVAGAKGRRFKPGAKLHGKAVACRVTARNKVGKATATSKPVKV